MKMCLRLHTLLYHQSGARLTSTSTFKDTVFAVSSGHGKAGVAVVRVSGIQSSKVVREIGNFKKLPKPRKAILKKLIDPKLGHTIDHGLVLWFPGPSSFTGEDSAEFHIHGGPAVVCSLLQSIGSIPGLKPAEAGDFTKRAFLKGKLDLTEVEGLADLIHAETESQRKQALRQMEGDLSDLYHKWSRTLLKCVAHFEANIDFGEEENIEDDIIQNVLEKIENLKEEIKDHLSDGRRGERLRSGIDVAIIGAPNVGKSSLLNILCQKPAAIVSEYAGTTRDIVESSIDLYGFPVILSDTAGLRDGNHPVEEEGIRRAVKRGEEADLKILVADCESLKSYITNPQPVLQRNQSFAEFAKTALNKSIRHQPFATSLNPESTIIVMNKTDIFSPNHQFSSLQGAPVCWISCKTLNGLESFLNTLKEQLNLLGGNPLIGNPRLTQIRHRYHLDQCLLTLTEFSSCVSNEETSLVKGVEYIRLGLRELGKITGRVGVEEILDVVFRDFCIGK